MNIRYPIYEGVYRILTVQNPFQFDIIHYCFNKYTNYQTFIILPLFYIPQKSVELSHTL